METKICKICKTDKSIDAFKPHKNRKDGIDVMCIICKEELHQINIKKYITSDTRTKSCTKCKHNRFIYEFGSNIRNKDGLDSWCRTCRHQHTTSELHRHQSKQYWTNNPKLKIVTTVKGRCKRENIPFNLTIDDFEIPSHCPILGIPIILNEPKISNHTPSLDRLIPEVGYVKNNVNVISMKANHIKSNCSFKDIENLYNWMREQLKNHPSGSQ